MSKECTLEIRDECNVKFVGLDAVTRRKICDASKFFIPHAKHLPAYKLGRWDGYERFCNTGGVTYLNLVEKLLPIVVSDGYSVNVDDKRVQYNFSFPTIDENSYSNVCWPKGHELAGQPIILRDHQVEIINSYFSNLQGIGCVATGSGKTLITAILSDKASAYGRVITIVPNKDLVTQTEADFKNIGLDVGVYFGDRKEPGHRHTICTWQSLEALDKKSKYFDPDFSIVDFMHDVVAVIVDEAHSSKASVLRKHLTDTFASVPIRWGMTGTIPKEEYEYHSLLCSIGPVVNTVKAKDLQDKGILSDLHINVLQLRDHLTDFRTYQEELKYLVTDTKRIKFIAKKIKEISSSGNTLVLVDRVVAGEELSNLLPGSVFISGDVKSETRKAEYKEVSTSDDKIIVATYGVAAVGINIPRIFNLIMIEPGKSFVRVIQTIGRGVRKAHDKDFVNIWDITSTAKFSKRHLTKRKGFYKQEQYPFTVLQVDIT